ncbi:MAG: hypothetical protein ABJF88_15960 [Rhodothermales bacterium]
MPFSQARLDFDPSRDGFAFPNSFRWTEPDLVYLHRMLRPVAGPGVAALPAVGGAVSGGWRGLAAGTAVGAGLAWAGLAPALVRASAQRWPSFGLCGGMALAAAERWPRRAGLPTAELQADRLRPLLWRRQADTLRAAAPTFLRYWLSARLGRARFGDALLSEWTTIRGQIDAGRPVVLGLVGDAPDPFAQHQVLAFGYAGTDTRGTLSVYDPNSPGVELEIAFTVADGRARITTDLPTGPTRSGGYHISTRPGRLDMVFAVDV